MPALTFIKPRLMQWNTSNITDHNRSPLSVTIERIERSQRMANGQLRKYFIADKSSFSMSWENVPRTVAHTVDGFLGGDGMLAFWTANQSTSFPLKIYYGDSTLKTFTVVFSNFSYTVSKRGLYDFWNVSCEMTEV